MAEARSRHFKGEAARSQAGSAWKYPEGPQQDDISRLLDLRDAMARFGLTKYQVYMAVKRGELEALQREGGGRVYYSERQLRALMVRVTDRYQQRAA